MRTVSLSATLESSIRIVRFSLLKRTVTLNVDGNIVTLRAGDELVNTVQGDFHR